MNICAIIPARYHSSRLEGKPLLKINGKSIISMTYHQVCQSKYLDIQNIYVSTDDDRIATEIENIGGNVIFCKESCLNGTERICRSLSILSSKYEVVVNVQGDEPYISPEAIDFMIEKHFQFSNSPDIVCTTLHSIIREQKYLHNSSFGKMVIDKNNNILYASRTLIPATKTGEINPNIDYLTHIGVFVFKREFLKEFLEYPNTPLQLSEDIEWLKILEMGYKIKSFQYDKHYEIGVNTTDDYNYLKNKYEK